MTRVVRVHRVSGVRADARGGGEHALVTIRVAAERRRRAAQERLQQRARRARARSRADLLVIETHEDRDVPRLGYPVGGEALQRHQARVHAGEVVLSGCRHKLPLVAEEARALTRREDQIEGSHARRVGQASRPRNVLQDVAVGIVHGPHGVQVLLRIERQPLRVHPPVQVNGQLRDASDRSGASQHDLAVAQDQTTRQGQLPVQPRVPHHSAVHLDVDLTPAVRRGRLDRRLDGEGRRIRVCAHDAESRVLGHVRRDQPCSDGPASYHDVPAGACIPRVVFIDPREAGVHQALSHDLGGVVGGGGVEEEMLIVHRVRVDVVQFKLCHISMVERGARWWPTLEA